MLTNELNKPNMPGIKRLLAKQMLLVPLTSGINPEILQRPFDPGAIRNHSIVVFCIRLPNAETTIEMLLW